jgi:anaerobic dimethyl sulfoxide reductase subunit A
VALIAAIGYVWATEDEVDEAFMASHTVGYQDYHRYLIGQNDGIPKTPDWAATITGVPSATIYALAREYASAEPAILLAGLGPQRSRYGEQTERALIALVCMSGNVGTSGGGMAHVGRHAGEHISMDFLPSGPFKPARTIRQENWGRYLLDASLQPPVRMAYIVATNAINRSSNTRANARALAQLDYIVVNEPFFTPTARYADIVLPICVDLERPDLVSGGGDLYYNRQALPLAGESRTDYWVFARLAERLCFGDAFTDGKDEAEWVAGYLAGRPDAHTLEREGIVRAQGMPDVPLASFRADPVGKPLRTPSGLIEIACEKARDSGLPLIPSYLDPRPDYADDHPLQLVTPHSKYRANSCGHANPWLQRLEAHSVWMHPRDANARGIGQGEWVEVYNPFGVVALPAKLTERIKPGVVCIYQGTWYRPGEDGVDVGGCANVLTSHRATLTGGMTVHSEWVEVRRRGA